MNEKVEKIYTERIVKFQDRVFKNILSNNIQLEAKYFKSSEHVLFNERLKGKYIPISEGEIWGEAWENAWFHLKGKIPDTWAGSKVVAKLNFTGEALIFDLSGFPKQSLTSSSVYNVEFKRDIFPLFENCNGGESVEFWVEAVAIGYLGINLPLDPKPKDIDRHGEFKSRVNDLSIAIFNEELWQLWLDLEVLKGVADKLPEKSVRRVRIIRNINQAIDAFKDDLSNAQKSRMILKKELSKPAAPSDLSVLAVGHAHIDTAWLWPVSETIRKIGRSFANQVALLEKYPEYVFGASQPQHYVFAQKYYPELFEKLKKYIKEGRWELQGGMWVEADNNLISGESMIRQIIFGKNYFMDEFGFDVKNLWLPDVFGYSASLPQILRKSGIDYFLTQKMSWSQINEFPYNTFYWRGIDGSEVLSHFPPENNYNSQLSPKYIIPGRDNFKEKDFIDQFISLFGVGDGGGGPKEENIEFGKRMSDLEGVPKLEFGRADNYFEGLNQYSSDLPVWDGELYLEFHRGTLTSHGSIKRNNRKLEHRLRELEILNSCLPIENYPYDDFNLVWEKVLINQFHDIIPGSSVKATYVNTHEEYSQANKSLDLIEVRAQNMLFEKSEDSTVLFNSLSYTYAGIIELPENWDSGLTDSDGNKITVQKENNNVVSYVEVSPFSFLTLTKTKELIGENDVSEDLVLENDFISYVFNKDGQLIKIFDKDLQLDILEEERCGNILSLYDDHPLEWDAWDVDIFYKTAYIADAIGTSAKTICDGPVRKGIKFELRVSNSTIEQYVYLNKFDKRLDFQTKVNWNEKHRMLRVSFPVNVITNEASFDIQYGILKRNTHQNTSWDLAKFETCAHRYADLSIGNYGVALLNDSKYGYNVHKNILDLNLLRSPVYPDPDADIGDHEFTYSLLPHTGDLINSNVISQAAQMNQGIMIFNGYKNANAVAPCTVTSDSVSLEQVKKAEKENCLILRFVETKGIYSEATIQFGEYPVRLRETNLIEWEDKESVEINEELKIHLKPFEIRTYKLFK